MRRWFWLLAIGLMGLTGFAKEPDCHYVSLKGREFVFREMVKSQQDAGYRWTAKPGKHSYRAGKVKTLKYKKYVGMRGKVLPELYVHEIKKVGTEYYFVAVLENCETVYAFRRVVTTGATIDFGVHDKDLEYLSDHHQIYFPEELEEDHEKVGDTIWVNRHAMPYRKELFNEKKRDSVPVTNCEPLTIVGFETLYYGPTKGDCPYYFVARKATGEKGLYPCNPIYYYTRNPIKEDWPGSIADAIREERAVKGMTLRQLKLSWGEPRQKETITPVDKPVEHWVFGHERQVLIEEGKVIHVGTIKEYKKRVRYVMPEDKEEDGNP